MKVEASTLIQLQNEFAVKLKELEDKIYSQAGEKFNLNSPKQLGHILFEKLGLPVIKKTKTGYSTSVEVLDQLKTQSPIVSEILDYRQIAKIQSTYVKGLLDVIQPDGRVHTRYLQTLTATGRLSSVDPNLQISLPALKKESKSERPSCQVNQTATSSLATIHKLSFVSWPTFLAIKTCKRPSRPDTIFTHTPR